MTLSQAIEAYLLRIEAAKPYEYDRVVIIYSGDDACMWYTVERHESWEDWNELYSTKIESELIAWLGAN